MQRMCCVRAQARACVYRKSGKTNRGNSAWSVDGAVRYGRDGNKLHILLYTHVHIYMYTHPHTHTHTRGDRAKTCVLVILVGSEILFAGVVFVGLEHHRRCRTRSSRCRTGMVGEVFFYLFFFPPVSLEYGGLPQVEGKRNARTGERAAFQLSLADRPRDEEQPCGMARRRRINVDKYCGRDRQPNPVAAVVRYQRAARWSAAVASSLCVVHAYVRWVYRIMFTRVRASPNPSRFPLTRPAPVSRNNQKLYPDLHSYY